MKRSTPLIAVAIGVFGALVGGAFAHSNPAPVAEFSDPASRERADVLAAAAGDDRPR